ncbi:MAG TPA: SPOR domain-containing protein [Bryobacteraceae bacterium]|nr:SPOR domain-containing protein [Bryobacteraceae bacterium]
MRNKETGEFELVVGDKQLLSGFFIGVLLLAVVFAMGYVLGQNSPKSGKATEAAAQAPATSQPENRPQPASPAPPPSPESTPAGSSASPASQPADASQPGGAPPAEAPPQPTTQPAREAAASAAAPAKVEPPAPQAAAEPANGTYWQVTARATRASAQAVYQTLKDQGFPAEVRPGPNNLTVVWVGPYTDKDSLARAKKQLEDAGFSQLIRKP